MICVKFRAVPTPLHAAVLVGNVELARILISQGADIFAKYKDAIPAAFAKLKEDTVMLQYLTTTLQLAIEEIERFCKQYRGSMGQIESNPERALAARDNIGATLLHKAATNSSIIVVGYLISKGADTNARDKTGNTPLHMASRNKDVAIAKLLIENGAEINVKSNSGKTPLDWAKEKENPQMAEYLESIGGRTGEK